jgi:hypothetical protein
MNSHLLISLLCAGAVALACGTLARGDESNEQKAISEQRARQRAHHDVVRRDVAARTVAGTEGARKVNGTFAVNIEPHGLRFALDLTNQSKKHVELAFRDGQPYDFAVLDSARREVYRWGQGRMFTQSVQNKRIDGGKTMRIAERVETTLPHGKYVAVATLRSSNFPMKQSSTFELR